MELHEKYVQLSRIDISLLETMDNTFKYDPYAALQRLTSTYIEEMQTLSTRKLETLRALLCCQYQHVFEANEKRTLREPLIPRIQRIEITFFSRMHGAADIDVLYDNILLQLVLYYSINDTKQCLLNFHQFMENDFNTNDHGQSIYTTTMNCFLESIRLRQFLYNDTTEDEFKVLFSIFLRNIKTYIKKTDDINYATLALILSKIIEAFYSPRTLIRTWNFILDELVPQSGSLAPLCVMANIYFPTKPDVVHADILLTWKLWELILSHVTSSMQQNRKFALFMMKNSIEVLHKLQNAEYGLPMHRLVPFVCKQKKEHFKLLCNVKNKFFLVMEALEQKQCHLVIPALSYVPDLIKIHNDSSYECCCNMLTVWIRCIFQRILSHENITVIKWGLIHACTMDTTIYNDDKFLKLFLCSLNNTMVYKCKDYEKEPEIMVALSKFFVNIRASNVELFYRIFKEISKMTWAPVAICYIILSTKMVKHEKTKNVWQSCDLLAIKSIVSCLATRSHILLIHAQTFLLETVTAASSDIHDMKVLANTLTAFSPQILSRGTVFWKIVTNWLSQMPEAEDMGVNFVVRTSQQYLQNTSDILNARSFALMVFLLHDADLIFTSNSCIAKAALQQWLQTWSEVDCNNFASYTSICEFAFHLHEFIFMGQYESNDGIKQLLFHCGTRIVTGTMKAFEASLNTDHKSAEKYLVFIISYLKDKGLVSCYEDLLPCASVIRDCAKRILDAKNTPDCSNDNPCKEEDGSHEECSLFACFCALRMLYYAQKRLMCLNKEIYSDDLYDLSSIEKLRQNIINKNRRDAVVSKCHAFLNKLAYQYFSLRSDELCNKNIDGIYNLLDVGGIDCMSTIIRILKLAVDKNKLCSAEDIGKAKSVIATLWMWIFLYKGEKVSKSVVVPLTETILSPNFLYLPGTMNFVKSCIDKLLDEGDRMPYLKVSLLTCMKTLNADLLYFQEPLLACLLHGYTPGEAKRVELQLMPHIVAMHTRCPQLFPIEEYNIDATIRAMSFVLLHKIICENPKYTSKFVKLVLARLDEHKNKRYYDNSYLHRTKHRIMQILLILEPFLDKTSIDLLQETLCDSILSESDQRSVQLMQQWLLIKIFVKNKELRDCKLWHVFEQSFVQRPRCSGAITNIIYHVAKLLDGDVQRKFICKAVPYIVRCCMGPHFNVRHHNQTAFVEFYNLMKDCKHEDDIKEYKGLFNTIVENTAKEVESVKRSLRTENNFFHSTFHPMNHYNLQTIYLELPRWCNIEIDELIVPHLFKALNFVEDSHHPLRLYNSDNSLPTIVEVFPLSTTRLEDTTGQKEASVVSLAEINPNNWGDIQRKVNSFEPSQLYHSDIFELPNAGMANNTATVIEEGMILMASLVDKPANLGGLARTCEILGVQQLVLADRNVTSSKEFQSLSVTAEKWINIVEVKPHQMQEFLLEKKKSGWSLVGAEQTAKSISLVKTKFNKKLILVLGNEKNGITADLIPLLDRCVEIPQHGVIRSLNVHVTGAICMWQYANQYIFDQSPS